MSPWGWRPERTQGIWRHGPLWFRQLALLSPWASAALGLMLMYVVGDSLTAARGLLFDLPDAAHGEGEATSLVALVVPLKNETTVFFDDARYTIDDGTSAAGFGGSLSDRIARSPHKTLLVLADRRVPSGDLVQIAAIARASGVKKVLLANKHKEDLGE